jgi:hypothetical protein
MVKQLAKLVSSYRNYVRGIYPTPYHTGVSRKIQKILELEIGTHSRNVEEVNMEIQAIIKNALPNRHYWKAQPYQFYSNDTEQIFASLGIQKSKPSGLRCV